MRSAVKIRLEVSCEEKSILDGQSKIANWLYNHLLERANKLRDEYRQNQDDSIAATLYTKRGMRNLIPEIKRHYPFLNSVYSSPLKNAALRLSSAIQEYQKSRKGQRKKINWPHFQKWKRNWFSLLYDEPWKGYRLEGRILQLQLGVDSKKQRISVSGSLSETFPDGKKGMVKQLRITKESGEFFAIFTLEDQEMEEKNRDSPKIVALDPNHKNLGYGVDTDGQAIEIMNLTYLQNLDERIDLLKSRRDRCKGKSKLVEYKREDGTTHRHWEPSRRWTYFNKLLEKAYQKRREQTKTFLYTLANRLCKDYDIIGIGDYTPHGGGITTAMRRAMNNRSLIGRFKEIVAWVAVKSGKVFVEYEETGTTRTCHLPGCQHKVAEGISPEIREWRCPNCQTLHIRDENAAQNGLIRTLEKLNLPCSGHTPVEIRVRWAWQVTPSGVHALCGGEAVQALL